MNKNVTPKLSNYIMIFILFFLLNYHPSSPGYTSGAEYNLYSIFFLIGIFIYLIVYGLKYDVKLTLNPLKKLNFLLLITLIGFILLNSVLQSTFDGINQSFWVLGVLIILILYHSIKKSDFMKDFTFMSKSIIFFGLISIIIAFYVRFISEINIGFIYIKFFHNYPRLKGLFASPIGFSSFIGLSIISILYYMVQGKFIKNIAFFFLLIIALLLGASRGPILSVGIALAIFYILYFMIRDNKKIRFLIPLTFVFLISILVFLAIENIYGSFSIYIEDILRADRNYDPRFDIWQKGIEMYHNQPLLNQIFGGGSGNFFRVVGHSPDNLYIRLLIDYGVISLVLFLLLNTILVIEMINYIFKNKSHEIIIFLCWIIYLLIRQFTNQTLFTVSVDTILYLYIIISFYFKKEKNYDLNYKLEF